MDAAEGRQGASHARIGAPNEGMCLFLLLMFEISITKCVNLCSQRVNCGRECQKHAI